ncbi:hypothetical protein MRX96_055141 [Rhipicephalus microplus]
MEGVASWFDDAAPRHRQRGGGASSANEAAAIRNDVRNSCDDQGGSQAPSKDHRVDDKHLSNAAEGIAGGAHDAVCSSSVAALQHDSNESGDDACTDAGPENVNATQSMAMVKNLSDNEPDDFRGGKKDTGECRSREQDVAVVSIVVDAKCGDATRQNDVADAEKSSQLRKRGSPEDEEENEKNQEIERSHRAAH